VEEQRRVSQADPRESYRAGGNGEKGTALAGSKEKDKKGEIPESCARLE